MLLKNNEHRFFDAAANYVFCVHAFAYAVEATQNGFVQRYPSNHWIVIHARVMSKELKISPDAVTAKISVNDWPTELLIHEADIDLRTAGRLNLGEIGKPLYAFGQSMFTSYYEQTVDQIEAKYGQRNANRWPAAWNFGWLVRNALSHGGGVYFRNTAANPVSWRGLSYSPSDNGKPILHHDLWPGDLIYLMLDMDAVL